MTATSEWSWSGAARAAVIGAVSLLIGGALGEGLSRLQGGHRASDGAPNASAAAPRFPPASPEILRLLSPLVVGSELGTFKIRAIEGPGHLIRVVCTKEASEVRVAITLAADGTPAPAGRAGPFAMYFTARGATDEEAQQIVDALAKVIPPTATPPAALRPFREGTSF